MRLFRLSLFAAALSVAVLGAAPVIGPPVNQASFESPLSPTYGIAQGSMFAVFGAEMGPAELIIAGAFPLTTELAGTSVQVAVDGETVDCILVFTSAGQLAAILPSATPLGDGEIRVSYNGETSDPQPIRVVANAVGMFTVPQNGQGPAVVTNAEFAVNTYVNSFAPGDVAIAWVTGLGARSADDRAVPEDLKDVYDVEVGVGGISAEVLYAGPSGCCAGVDQIVYVIPGGGSTGTAQSSGPAAPENKRTGCWVPTVIKAGGTISNFTSTSVSDDGPVCGDDHGFSKEEMALLHEQGFFRLLTVRATHASASIGPPIGAGESAGAREEAYPVSQGPAFFHALDVAPVVVRENRAHEQGITAKQSCSGRTQSLFLQPEAINTTYDDLTITAYSGENPVFQGQLDPNGGIVRNQLDPLEPGRIVDRLDLDQQLAPRLAASYDVRGDGRIGGDLPYRQVYGRYFDALDQQVQPNIDLALIDGAAASLAGELAPGGGWRTDQLVSYADVSGALRQAAVSCNNGMTDKFVADWREQFQPNLIAVQTHTSFFVNHDKVRVEAQDGGAQADPSAGLDLALLDIQGAEERSYSIPATPTVAYTAALSGGAFPGGSQATANCNVNVNNLGVAVGCGHNLPGAVGFSIHVAGDDQALASAPLPPDNAQFTGALGLPQWRVGGLAPPRVNGRATRREILLRIYSPTEVISGSLEPAQ